MNRSPFVSIIVPTYNRSTLLKQTLDSLAVQEYPADCFEIIVADNASTDDTQQVISDCCKVISNLKSIRELRQGVHFARNSAAIISRGEILYFTDDDMVADRGMLRALVDVFSIDPRIGAATGTILGRFTEEPPAWVKRCMVNAWLSLTPLENRDLLVVSQRDMVFSCHQAIRREAFFRSGGFNPENTAGTWVGDGETGLNIKLASMGYLFCFTVAAITHHCIPPSRTTLRYLIRRLSNQGYCDAFTLYRSHRSRLKLVRGLILHVTFGALKICTVCLTSIIRRRESWQFLLAWQFYIFCRTMYDLKLFFNAEFRRIAEIDDWLSR